MARSRAARFFGHASRSSITESIKQQTYNPPPMRTLTLARPSDQDLSKTVPTGSDFVDNFDIPADQLTESTSFPEPSESLSEPLFHDVYIDSDQSFFDTARSSASSRRWSLDSRDLEPLSPIFGEEHYLPTQQAGPTVPSLPRQGLDDDDLDQDSDNDSLIDDYQDGDDIELHDSSDVQGVSYFSAGKPLLIDIASIHSGRSRNSTYTARSASSCTGTQYDDSDKQSSVATSNSSISDYAGIVPASSKLYGHYPGKAEEFEPEISFPMSTPFEAVGKGTFFVDTAEDVLAQPPPVMSLPGLAW